MVDERISDEEWREQQRLADQELAKKASFIPDDFFEADEDEQPDTPAQEADSKDESVTAEDAERLADEKWREEQRLLDQELAKKGSFSTKSDGAQPAATEQPSEEEEEDQGAEEDCLPEDELMKTA